MSHNIQSLDVVLGLERFWHGLNKIVKEILFKDSGQTFQIVPQSTGSYEFLPDLKAALEAGSVEKARDIVSGLSADEGWKRFACSDNGHLLHIAAESYTPIQPERIWQIIGNSLGGIKHQIVSCGTLGNRAKLFISVEILDQGRWQIDGQQYQSFLNFCTANDGTMALRVHDSSIKVVCQNTFNMSLASGHKFDCSVQHTKESEGKIQNLEKTIEIMTADRQVIMTKLQEMESKPCSPDVANDAYMGFLIGDKAEKPSGRLLGQVQKLGSLFGDAREGNLARTRRNWLEGGTSYYTKFSSGGLEDIRKITAARVWRQVDSSEFGFGRNQKVEMFKIADSDDLWKAAVERGQETFKLARSEVTVAVGGIEDTSLGAALAVVQAESKTEAAPVADAKPAPKAKAPKAKAPKLAKSRR